MKRLLLPLLLLLIVPMTTFSCGEKEYEITFTGENFIQPTFDKPKENKLFSCVIKPCEGYNIAYEDFEEVRIGSVTLEENDGYYYNESTNVFSIAAGYINANIIVYITPDADDIL